MKVLLTGAAGNLGSAAFAQLIEAGFEVRATDMRRRPGLPGRVRVGDLLSREFCYELTEDIDVVVHVANHPNAGAGTPQKVFNENVTMNMNVFQAAMESGVKKIVYASSVQATNGKRGYEPGMKPSSHPYLPLDGNIPQNPGNPYALSKCAGEMQLQYFVKHHELASATAVRFPMLMPRQWFGDWKARQASFGHMIHPHMPMEEAFTWLSMEDAGRLLRAIVQTELPGYRCYFPAHSRPRTALPVRQIITDYFANVPLKKPLEQMEAMVDISQITRETGWAPVDDYMA